MGTIYYPNVIDANTFTVHTNEAEGVSGANPVNLTADGNGTHTVRSGLSWLFNSGTTGFSPTAPHDNKLTTSVTFKVNGVPTFQS